MSRRRNKANCPLGGASHDKCCGYCHLHKSRLTPKQMRNRKCLDKRCRHFVPWKQHPLWEQRAVAKEKRKMKKMSETETVVTP